MIYAQPGSTFEATSNGASTGLVGTIGVRIVDGQGGTTLARSTASIVESPAGSGIYTARIVAPATAGQYVVVWDTGGGSPTWASEDLTVSSSSPAASVPSGLDLCALADVKALMQKSGGNAASQDSLIQTLITRWSTKIMRDYGREFVPGGPLGLPAVNATRTLEYAWGDQYPGEAFVDFRPYDLQMSPAPVVSVDTDQSSPIVLSTDEWRLWPQPPSQGVFMAIKVLPLNVSAGIIGWRKRQITVTGNWGFPSIPPEVTEAAIECVLWTLTNYPGMSRPDGYDSLAVATSPRSYPMSALDLLGSFKRMTV